MMVAGFGCASRVTDDSLRALLGRAKMAGKIDALACPEARAAVLRPLALTTGVPLIALPAQALAGVTTPTQSPRMLDTFGTGSVAEACALVAVARAGAMGARIVVARMTSEDGLATCAVAEGEQQ
ncbi:cobalamin biosynthesis protein [Roseinatronobacter alkalisoli]|uniref:Cobalamin biosynthesis protein n=1 Tax=Roseinatronobacter alkalisoli TaxID=3028235 RepID=A0ABT5T7W7_9RHOB|nr:cobalamin biosynthesis protein [Roseinatronobacter sp. HJB301]MDD7970790.1 cobalamin biosynthesis protein [Roseinatronobacter sp. HJB301]